MNKYKAVPFEVVEIWYNNIYEPFTLQPIPEHSHELAKESKKHYAIKIGNDFFELSEAGNGLHICDWIDE